MPPPAGTLPGAGRARGPGGQGEDPVNQDNRRSDLVGQQESHTLVTYSVELLDHGPEPDWHLDRTLFGPWQRYELIARNPAGNELARARGFGNADCWYRLASELRRAMHWTR